MEDTTGNSPPCSPTFPHLSTSPSTYSSTEILRIRRHAGQGAASDTGFHHGHQEHEGQAHLHLPLRQPAQAQRREDQGQGVGA
jgi:hypothetical protein